MKDHDKALETYQEGLKHEPNSEELKEGVRRCMEHINKVGSVCKMPPSRDADTIIASRLLACQQPAHCVCLRIAQRAAMLACLLLTPSAGSP